MTKYTLLLWAIGQAFQRRLLSRMRLRRACCNALKWKTTNSGWNAMTRLHRTTTPTLPRRYYLPLHGTLLILRRP